MATCIYGVRLTEDHHERCAWCWTDRERERRVDDINKLRELIREYGARRRDVGAFSGMAGENARKALREASRKGAEIYDEIERILYRLRAAQQPQRGTPEIPPGGSSLTDPGQQETHACATCGAFVEYVPAKFNGDPDQGWRHKGLPPREVRPHVVLPQSLD